MKDELVTREGEEVVDEVAERDHLASLCNSSWQLTHKFGASCDQIEQQANGVGYVLDAAPRADSVVGDGASQLVARVGQ